jgi:hypothetical protein
MPDAAAAAKNEAEISRSFLEYTLAFETPILESWEHRTTLSGYILAALKPWGFNLDGVEVKTPEKVGDHAIIFRRTSPPNPPRALALFLGKIFISAENLDWSEAEAFMSAMTAGIEAVRAFTGCAVGSQNLGLGMHVQLKNKPLSEVTAPLISATARELLDGDIRFSGVVINREKSNITIEMSAMYANALWVRMFREHPAAATLPDIAVALRKDEEQLFKVLALEGVL